MHVLVDEFITGGGLLGAEAPPASLLREGRAMLSAVTADLAAIDGVRVTVLLDQRRTDVLLPYCEVVQICTSDDYKRAALLSATVDWSLVIAPEIDNALATRVRALRQAGGRVMAPDDVVLTLLSDKDRTARHLAEHGVRVPDGFILTGNRLPPDFKYPAVLKPLDGAGSQGVQLVNSPSEALAASSRPRRLEHYCPGTPASVAFLCGPTAMVALAPCVQRLSSDGQFRYLGGSLPLAPPLAKRATELARRAVDALDGQLLGYIGVDLILGAANDGHEDYVIEINPRLTTSYVGLRAAATINLAESMLRIAEPAHDQTSSAVAFRSDPLSFEADGRIRSVHDENLLSNAEDIIDRHFESRQ